MRPRNDQSNIESIGQQSIGVDEPGGIAQSADSIIVSPGMGVEFAISSIEELIAVATISPQFFKEVELFADEWDSGCSDELPKLTVTCEVSQERLHEIRDIFDKININITFDHFVASTSNYKVKLQDQFRRLLFGKEKYAILKTNFFNKSLQDSIQNAENLFGDPALTLKKISQYCFMIRDGSQRAQGSKQKVRFNSLECCPLADCKVYFQISSPFDPPNIAFPSSKLAAPLSLLPIGKITALVKFEQKISIYLEVSFKDEQPLVSFLERNYDKFKTILFFSIDSPRLKCQIPFSELHNTIALLGKRIKQVNKYLNILENEEEQPQTSTQSVPVMVSEQIYEELMHRLKFGGDLLCLEPYWSPKLIEDFFDIYQMWDVEKYKLETIFTTLFSILNYKVHTEFKIGEEKTSQIYEMVYPGITSIVGLFVSKLRIGEIEMKKKPSSNPLDMLLMDFMKEIDYLNKGQGFMFTSPNKDGIPLKDFIANCEWFLKTAHKWTDIFNCITIGLKSTKYTTDAISQRFQKVEECRYPTLDCLACTKFFYYNYTNIITPNRKVPLKVFPLAERFSDYDSQILETICRMLNGNGGVILFNCVHEYRQVLPRGCLLDEKGKQSIENKLNYILGSIHPRPEIGTNVIMSFVPLAFHPLNRELHQTMSTYKGEEQIKPYQVYNKHTYLEGTFVTRIKVCPTDSTKVYLYNNGTEYFLFDGDRVGNTRLRRLRKTIKRKLEQNRRNSLLKFKDKSFSNPLSHPCEMPDSGVIIDSKPLGLPDVSTDVESLEDEFPHMSMLICSHKYLKHVKDTLQSKGVKCESEIRFAKLKFKYAANASIIYHDCKLDELVRLLRSSAQLSIEGKPLTAIYITRFVKIENLLNFNIGNIERTAEWLRRELPQERLKLFEQIVAPRRSEYYLQTITKVGIYFVYNVLQTYGIKVSFKNPLNYDKMSESERLQSLKEVSFSERNNESEPILIPEPQLSEPSPRQTLLSLQA